MSVAGMSGRRPSAWSWPTALLLGACGEPDAPQRWVDAATASAPMATAAAAAPAICDEGGDSLPDRAALDALGTPAAQHRFTLAEPIGEFRIKLLNHFRLPRDAATAIWERTWAKGDCRLTIWSTGGGGTWRPVERLHWSAGDTF